MKNSISYEYLLNTSVMKNNFPKYKEGIIVYKGSISLKVVKPIHYNENKKQWTYQLVNTLNGAYEYHDEKELTDGIFTNSDLPKGWE